jgi:Domain of unknown function (DUF4954)
MIMRPLGSIGYEFIQSPYLPEGKDEYYLRNMQNRSGITYRQLSAYEIEVLVRNNNTSDDWNKIKVSNAFNPELVKNCKFFGLVRIGKLESVSLEYHNVCMPVGLYNSTIISCDFGDNVIINNVNYISHYIVGNEVMIINVHELHTTDHAKFGNGILKDGEDEAIRIWVEVRNENAGRKIIPFNGMLPGDAYIWSRYREDEALMEQLKLLTERKFDKLRGYYGKIGDRCVIKNTSIIKDVWIGSDAYIKGANKLKNLTINSDAEAETQIGEGCELVNGIIGVGCRIFYGAKAVRFVMASHSQLKYGARLINSYLGNNSTISCCEVLNSLIFPAHEQHHNNSFLCAALVMGQSNIAAGATIGSNHNSRAADGEFIASRGFWPGLCVSLKHNSIFASFTLLAKGDYSYELNVPIPFSLVSNDVSHNKLVVMPAYWFMYNLYALARNSGKYADRDKRTDKTQFIEYDFLAPDSVNEIFLAFGLLEKFTALAIEPDRYSLQTPDAELMAAGAAILNNPEIDLSGKPIYAYGFENHSRKVELLKVREAYFIYRRLVVYYGVQQLIDHIDRHRIETFELLRQTLPAQPMRLPWSNVGGQLIPTAAVETLVSEIKSNQRASWEEVHAFYKEMGALYTEQKLQHAFASLLNVLKLQQQDFTKQHFIGLLDEVLETKEWMTRNIFESRAKDYQSEYRKMVYDNDEQMEKVIGSLDENVFINQQNDEFEALKSSITDIRNRFG